MDLIEQLEALRIQEADFFGVPKEITEKYERANEMLDDCLEIIWKWIREHHLELELIT